VRPGAVSVRIINLDHDVIVTDDIMKINGGRIVDGAEPKITPQDIGGSNIPTGTITASIHDIF
jgi:hypothetical protein